jgi:hypothetical protein
MVRKGYTSEQIKRSNQGLFQVEFDSLVFLTLVDYNQVCPHSAKDYHLPVPEAILTMITTQQLVQLLEASHSARQLG